MKRYSMSISEGDTTEWRSLTTLVIIRIMCVVMIIEIEIELDNCEELSINALQVLRVVLLTIFISIYVLVALSTYVMIDIIKVKAELSAKQR